MAEKKYSNGAKYIGAVNSSGKRHGYGTYYYSNGTSWSGQWRNGEKVEESTPAPTPTVKTSTNNKNQKQTSMKKTGILGNIGLELGKYTGDQLAYSPAGTAVKKKDGSFVVYNKETKTLIEIGDLKMDVPFYLVPTLYEQLQVGDLIRIDGSFYTVESKTENNGLKLQSPTTGSYVHKPARTTLFGLYFYTKVVSLLDSVTGAAAPAAGAAASPFGAFNPMMLMMLNKDSGSGGGLDLTQLMLMSQFSGGGVGGLNPMMLLATMGDKGGSSDDLMQLLLMSQISGTGVNPLASLFGAPAAAPAPAAPAAKA